MKSVWEYNMKRFVCFDDDGNIYKISKESDNRFKFLECDFEDVKSLLKDIGVY